MVFLTGSNAQGKTSLLEAIAVASRLGSPRASRQAQIVREGCIGCGVALETDEALFKAVYQDRKFELAIDGQPSKRGEYLEQSPRVVWMENRDLDLIRGSGEKRRRFLDAIGTQLSTVYARALRDYTKALRSRNAMLKENRSRDRSFEMFTQLLIQHGQALVSFRQQIIQDLLPEMEVSHHTISGQKEQFSMVYMPSASELASAMEASLQRDVIMKQTLVGPHRDDFALTVDQRPASDFASEGQQRTLAIALRLAQGRLLRGSDQEVLYLVDDVFGELDEERRQALLLALPRSAQKVLTTTNLNWGAVDAQVLQLSGYRLV